MKFRAIPATAAIVVSFLVVTGVASAATVCVNPNRASCQATIQAAVDAAVAGDTISIATGVYFENVIIPAGKDGLIIRGRRSAILDAGDDGIAVAPNTGVGIMVGSNDVTIRGITVRNGNSNQIELADAVTGTTINKVRSVNSDNNFVGTAGAGNDNTTVSRCDVLAPNGSAVNLEGNAIEVSGNTIRQTSSDAVDVTGDDAVVERNTLIGVENGDAISVSGNGADVVRNRISGVDSAGIDVNGDDAFVSRNRLSGTYDGLEVSGQRPVVTNNRTTGTVGGSEAIDVRCMTDCTGAMVSRNRADDIGDDTEGFNITSDAAGMVIEKNQTKNGIDTGFDLDITGATVSRNRVRGTGGDEEDCFDINGDDNTINRNVAENCMGNGFRTTGATNVLERNRASNAADDGFLVNGNSTNTTLMNNRSKGNGLTGYRIRDGGTPATGTTLTGNRGSKSRYDLCDEGVTTTRTGNSFGTELAVTQDGTEDCPTF